ncbi:L-threonylcarbamoyladenylate synthase [[Eubacterium] cellulosolvens]
MRTGGIIVYPTETLYGLGVDIYNDQAIERLIQLKRRPKNMPIAIAVANLDQVRALAMVSKLGLKIIENCIPKPITILLRATDKVNPKLTGGSALIGFRFPDHEVTKELISRFGPITATSANLHGGPNPLTIDSTLAQFGHKVGIYLDSGACAIAKPSTVIDATGETIKIIRHGACSGTELEECLSNRGN